MCQGAMEEGPGLHGYREIIYGGEELQASLIRGEKFDFE